MTEAAERAGARLEGKVAVVTGGGSGMGRSTVERYLAEGAAVVVADLNEETGKQVVADAEQAGHAERVAFQRVDVAREDDVEAMIALALERFGGLDVVFNNAGFGGAVGPITEISVADWDETMGVLVTGVFLGTKHAARVMIDAGTGGSIINTSSVAGISGGRGPQAYTTAKHAVIGLTRATAIELAEHRIRVNAICPGGINTPLLNFGDAETAGKFLDTIQPWPRHGVGEDIAAMAAFLAADESEFVTGQALVVDGGLTIGGRLDGGRRPMFENMTGMTRGSTGQPMDLRPIGD